MDKWQFLQNFWSGFGLTAYDENSVPDNAQMPYITYSAAVNDFEHPVQLTASLWYQSLSWAEASRKADEIAEAVTLFKPKAIYGGRVRLWQDDTPFAQRMGDPDDNKIKRIYLSIMAEFMTVS